MCRRPLRLRLGVARPIEDRSDRTRFEARIQIERQLSATGQFAPSTLITLELDSTTVHSTHAQVRK